MARHAGQRALALSWLTVAAAVLTVAATTDEGVAVRRDTPVTATDLRAQRGHNTPQLVADPTDERFVVLASRVDAVAFGCSLHASGDGGESWWPVRTGLELPEGADRCYAPQVAFDDDGRLYVVFMGLAGEGNQPMGVFLTTSTDRGRTFTTPQRVLGPYNYQVRLASDHTRDRLHLTWLHVGEEPSTGALPPPPNPILAAHSDDGGATWSDPVEVSDPARGLVVAPRIAVGPGGRVHVGYYDLGEDRRDYHGLEGPVWDGHWSLLVATSSDGGERFHARAVVTDEIDPPERVMLIFTMPSPALAALPEGGLVAAWPDARHGDPDVLAARAIDATNWQEPVRVNDDPPDAGATQLLPTLAAAPNGRVDALWLDRRRDPDNDVATDAYYAASHDGGGSFGANVAVNSQPFDARTGLRYPLPSAAGLVEWGGSLGLLAGDEEVVAAWPDTRSIPSGMEHQDIFATVLTHPPTGSLPAWLATRPVGLAVVVGLGLAVLVRRRRARVTTVEAVERPSEPALGDEVVVRSP